ncbi:DUF1997 domain-containing protein [Phormidesmis sp. 146-12]
MTEPTQFHSHFVDSMEMSADPKTVAEYLDAHHGWFRRCAHPMQVDAIGQNSYALTIGNFGAFGYEIEPKVGLDLLPQQEGVYRIETVPVPDYVTAGYEIDFRGAMELVELSQVQASFKTTRIQWQLDLLVSIQFPKFIHALPDHLIQKTGDRVLKQVVRQVSRRLTHKVQEDFHTSRGLPLPKRSRKWI